MISPDEGKEWTYSSLNEEANRLANALVADTSEVAVEVMQIQAVNVIDPAEAPGGPSGPRRSRYVAVGIMAGLFAAICLVIIEDMLDTRVRSGGIVFRSRRAQDNKTCRPER